MSYIEAFEQELAQKLVSGETAEAVVRWVSEKVLESYRHDHFLEVDRSSQQLNTLVNKAVCYREYYRSGGYPSTTIKSSTGALK